MKNFKYRSLLMIAFSALLMWNCSDDDKLPVDFEDLQVSGGAFATELNTEGLTNINKLDPATSSFSKSYQLITPNAGKDISKLEVFVNFTGINQQANEALYATINSDAFAAGSKYPEATFSADGASILSTLGISPDDLEGGDTFNFRLALTTPAGTFTDVSANFDNQSADHKFSATVVCELPAPPPGDWVVEMGDSFGDGWQTTTATGGPGITVTLNDGTVLEANLASGSSGTTTLNIPSGTTSADWFFPGDFYGEISFIIKAPSGNVVASFATGAAAAGPIALNLCNEI